MENLCLAREQYHDLSKQVGVKAYRALLEEVYTTPKPGLVDLYSCGAHKDMDVYTFEKSAAALKPYFTAMAELGLMYYGSPEELFYQIRNIGKMAEQAMYHVTDGVNTHKGIIFSAGIFCAAAGRCMKEYGRITLPDLAGMQLLMTRRILMEEIKNMGNGNPQSHGEMNMRKYNTLGIRGEAVRGYPAVWRIGLPVLLEGKKMGRDRNLVKLQALMSFMGQVEDSNIIARKGLGELKEIQQQSRAFLMKGGAYSAGAISELKAMDMEFIHKNVSAGGCADLLALSLFIEMLIEN